MSESLNEWKTRAAPTGSGRYYALLHSAPSLQERQRLLVALISIFSQLGFQSREIEVAQHKLDWWRNELNKETFQHPVMKALADTGLSQSDTTKLQQILHGYGAILKNGSPSGDDENQMFHFNTGAIACQLLCNTDNTAINSVGIALSQMRCHRYLRQHIENGLLCVPMSALETADLSPAALSTNTQNTSPETYPVVKQFLQDRQTVILKALQDTQNIFTTQLLTMPQQQQTNCKALYVYLQLQIKLLEAINNGNVVVLNEETRLTPLRNYWYAFKAARAFDRL